MEIVKKTILQAVTTGLTQGYWNATTNVPDITIIAETGYMWYVSISGNTLLGEIDEWNVGDWAMKYWGGWGKVINGISGSTGKTLIIPDFSVDYYAKIGLKQIGQDLGFMDAYSEPAEPVPPVPPEETFYLVDSEGNIFYDPYDSKKICY
jgi:hypothetical protein